jgi:hypothetical protein
MLRISLRKDPPILCLVAGTRLNPKPRPVSKNLSSSRSCHHPISGPIRTQDDDDTDARGRPTTQDRLPYGAENGYRRQTASRALRINTINPTTDPSLLREVFKAFPKFSGLSLGKHCERSHIPILTSSRPREIGCHCAFQRSYKRSHRLSAFETKPCPASWSHVDSRLRHDASPRWCYHRKYHKRRSSERKQRSFVQSKCYRHNGWLIDPLHSAPWEVMALSFATPQTGSPSIKRLSFYSPL